MERALPDFTSLIQRQGPAVVNVVVSGAPSDASEERDTPTDPFSEFFHRFAPEAPHPSPHTEGLGSGFIIGADGQVLTNAHVVADAETVTVRLADGKHEYAGKVIGIDRRSDVALLKIDAQNLPVASLGKSDAVRPGEWVAAIGAPFGFANTITAGIVSATERVLPGGSLVPFIQTDVAVNPGNSGGPLLDMSGNVIGINSMIYSGTGGYMGVSFAIPIEVALDVAHTLQQHGKVTRGRIGIGIQPMTQDLARAFKLDNENGVVVTNVEADGPAAKAGVKTGDVILAYNNRPVEQSTQLPRWVAATKPGERATLSLVREGARRDVPVTVGELPDETRATQRRAPARPTGASSDLGLTLSELPVAARHALGVDYGLLVEDVHGAVSTRIEPGDVIVGVDKQSFSSLDEFKGLVAKRGNEPMALLVRRGPSALFVAIEARGSQKADKTS